MRIVPNFITKMLGYLFKVIVLELNKLIYIKDMLVCYEFFFEAESLDFGAIE